MKSLFAFILTIGLLASCSEEPSISQEPRLVVEGWIDSDGYPMVFVTTSMTVDGSDNLSSDLTEHLIKWAKVTVSDGTTKVVLTGKYMKNYYPPYGFTTTELKGKCGNTYHLTVDYPPYHAEATTTIPPRPLIDSIMVAPLSPSDTLYGVKLHISENAMHQGGYKLFAMRKHKDSYPLSCYMGTYQSSKLNLPSQLPVYNVHKMDNKDFTPYFSPTDTLIIKAAVVDDDALQFWNAFESNVSLSKSPFLAPNENIKGNITGALGYWFGYGCNYYLVYPPQTLHAENP